MGPTGQGCPPSSGQVDLGSRVLNKRPPGQLMAQVAVSIHTPASGATRQFQHYATFVLVSIQAPTWGTTQKFPAPRHESFRFNPRARVGRDRHFQSVLQTIYRFQSTRPRGARLAFNGNVDVDVLVSIHAPAWGATMGKLIGPDIVGVSIHAPAWGATHPSMSSRAVFASFNPRARVGRDALHHLRSCCR